MCDPTLSSHQKDPVIVLNALDTLITVFFFFYIYRGMEVGEGSIFTWPKIKNIHSFFTVYFILLVYISDLSAAILIIGHTELYTHTPYGRN